MKNNFYGKVKQISRTDISLRAEEILTQGYTIIDSVIEHQDLTEWRKRIDDVYFYQSQQFGEKRLEGILDLDMCRAPLLHDLKFLELVMKEKILEVSKEILGEYFILNLQNAIINRPNIKHHQTLWHRDLPYHNAVSSSPLAINALFAIDDFTVETGATELLPYSHKHEALPSEEFISRNKQVAILQAGSIVMFDSMVYHRAGLNSSGKIRRGINQMYTVPMIKQFYNFPLTLQENTKISDSEKQVLGFNSMTPADDVEWREKRARRLGV